MHDYRTGQHVAYIDNLWRVDSCCFY